MFLITELQVMVAVDMVFSVHSVQLCYLQLENERLLPHLRVREYNKIH